MNPDQTNTKPLGPIAVLAGEALTGKRSYLSVLTHDTGVPEVLLPTSVNDLAIYQIDEEVLDGELTAVTPLVSGGAQRRVPLKSTCNPGDVLVLADPTSAADKGKVRKLPATVGVYVQIGIAEEAGVDTQHVLLRPVIKLVTVASVVAAPAAVVSVDGAIAAVNSTAVNPTKSDFDALLAQGEILADDVRALRTKVAAMHAAMVANGQVVIA
jgi:hypothetical protein